MQNKKLNVSLWLNSAVLLTTLFHGIINSYPPNPLNLLMPPAQRQPMFKFIIFLFCLGVLFSKCIGDMYLLAGSPYRFLTVYLIFLLVGLVLGVVRGVVVPQNNLYFPVWSPAGRWTPYALVAAFNAFPADWVVIRFCAFLIPFFIVYLLWILTEETMAHVYFEIDHQTEENSNKK